MAQLLADYTTDWLDLVFRWFHATTAIVWIGTSFYFVALDNHLNEPEREEDRAEGVSGESWEIHGGGFYRIHKFRVARCTCRSRCTGTSGRPTGPGFPGSRSSASSTTRMPASG